MSRNRPVSAFCSCWRVALSRGSPRAASAAGLRSPATRASRNRRPLAPNRSEITTEIFEQRVFQDFLHPGLVPGLVLGQPGPGAGQRPQVPDRLRRHERAAQHPPLVQLAVPNAVEPVAFAPPGQVLHVAGVDQPHFQPGRLGQVIVESKRQLVAGMLSSTSRWMPLAAHWWSISK